MWSTGLIILQASFTVAYEDFRCLLLRTLPMTNCLNYFDGRCARWNAKFLANILNKQTTKFNLHSAVRKSSFK